MVAVPSLSMLSEVEAAAFNKAVDLNNMTDLEKIHIPKVTLPPVVEDGNQAPIIVEIDHPMDDDHYIKSVQILNFNDPVVIKGQCFFTPQSGQAFVSTQIRLALLSEFVYSQMPCLLYTSPSPRDATLSRMPSSA